MILAGDIGGTKSLLGLYRDSSSGRVPAGLETVYHESYRSRDHSGLEEVVRRFLVDAEAATQEKGLGEIEAACFGIAGPVVNQRTETTNLPWTVDGPRLEERLSLGRVLLINDLEATGHGIPNLPADQLYTLSPGDPDPTAPAVLVAAGTGLGEAVLIPGPDGLRPIPGEGGHSDFSPRNDLEIGLLKYLLQDWPRVSVERVVSGPGLHRIYRYLREVVDPGRESEWVEERLRREDPSKVVSEAAMAGISSRCAHALDLFVSLYGAEAGNLALKVMALGGVYVGGGIAPKILPKLKDGTFLTGFREKGRMIDMMKRIPVHVILEPKTALLGAAFTAARIRKQRPSK